MVKCYNGYEGGAAVINIAICDDEPYMSEKIKELATAFFQKKNIDTAVCTFSSGRELLTYAGTRD